MLRSLASTSSALVSIAGAAPVKCVGPTVLAPVRSVLPAPRTVPPRLVPGELDPEAPSSGSSGESGLGLGSGGGSSCCCCCCCRNRPSSGRAASMSLTKSETSSCCASTADLRKLPLRLPPCPPLLAVRSRSRGTDPGAAGTLPLTLPLSPLPPLPALPYRCGKLLE
ncbi:hypothetical protein K438DRAFT_1828890 [Mycena galopus ATCC 62051]|nr:hypothetical protein K438DRAFT_1828890 [Mycena galopus ATCC 62051]